VFETAKPDVKAKKPASKGVSPPPLPPEPPRPPDDTSTLVRQAASTGTPPRGGPVPAPPPKSSQAGGPRSHPQPSSPPPLPKKEGARTDKGGATPPALPVQPGQAASNNPGAQAAQNAQTPPQPAAGPKGGRPVADLGKLFDGGDSVETLERALADEETSNARRPQTRTETSDIRNLFIEMAGNYVLPVRDFMFDVKSGEARVDWLHTCESSVRSLREAADSLAMGKLAHALEKFGEVLKTADDSQGPTIRGEMRDQLLAAYFNLIDLMPQAFGLDAERSRRETIIINSLLLQIPGVQRNTVDLMYAAGLTTLETIVGAKPDEVAAATGLSMEVSTKIVDKLQAHRKELEAGSLAGLPPTPAPEGFGAPPMPGTRGHRSASPTLDSVEAPSIDALESSIDVLIDDGQGEAPTSLHAAVKLLPPSSDRDLIDALVAELKAQQAEFATVSDGWTEAATTRRRELRKLRADALKKVNVVLIRLGETEGVSEIEKLSFEQKLERIERYLRA
jgi:hypothetical protein